MTVKNIISENNFSTVLAEYTPLPKTETAYQSEKQLEQDFLDRLQKLGYQRIDNPTKDVLINNLRQCLEELNKKALNDKGFTDKEWKYILDNVLSNSKDDEKNKTKKWQVENRYTINRDDGTKCNIFLVDKDNIFNNHLQVINQYSNTDNANYKEFDGVLKENYMGIYDVTILVNGLPLVHIELKRRGVAIKEAFNQIDRYCRDNFFADGGLYQWVQIFVISNGIDTKYYSNTTRMQSIQERTNSAKNFKKTSHSFEFTNHWADAKNRTITDIIDFTEAFFNKGTLLNILIYYCVFTVDEQLLVMRPYQIVATEKIIQQIVHAHQSKRIGTIEAGGYVWHTTGSGKTLTSFKTAQLATELEFVDKVLFVVDRKDLDYQTIKEFEKFGGKDSVSGNTSTAILAGNLKKDEQKIIVTTIQKLNNFVKNKLHGVYGKNCVIIFDECHRSQFGEMHREITAAFKKYFLFGFTGTPIFVDNAGSGMNTTQSIFGKSLHTYTIVDAIQDGNVLPFRVDLVDTIQYRDSGKDVKVYDIDRDGALHSKARIAAVCKYILDNFDLKTYRRDGGVYEHSVLDNTVQLAKSRFNTISEKKSKVSVRGFNSLFAVDSIQSAKLYYTELKEQISQRQSDLKIATIFCFAPNEDIDNLGEELETDKLDVSSRDFLESAINDYNQIFDTSWDTNGDNFGSFYKDVSMRIKNKQLDLLIVVNMFLTGFDATTLNTLWVDKNLKYHGLIQAFSRTNRILNSQKQFGNIVTFRKLEKQINDACALFGNKNANSVVVIRPFKDYYNGYDDKMGYKQIVELLQRFKFESGKTFASECSEKEFIKLFGQFLRMENILKPFDEFADKRILDQRQRQNYQSIYLDLREKYPPGSVKDRASITEDLVFEIELIRQMTVNIDYILLMVENYIKLNESQEKESAFEQITNTIDSRPELRSKKELILSFIRNVNNKDDIVDKWNTFTQEQKQIELDKIIKDENLKPQETIYFVESCLKNGFIKETGMDIDNILPSIGIFADGGQRRFRKKYCVISKLKAFLEKFWF